MPKIIQKRENVTLQELNGIGLTLKQFVVATMLYSLGEYDRPYTTKEIAEKVGHTAVNVNVMIRRVHFAIDQFREKKAEYEKKEKENRLLKARLEERMEDEIEEIENKKDNIQGDKMRDEQEGNCKNVYSAINTLKEEEITEGRARQIFANIVDQGGKDNLSVVINFRGYEKLLEILQKQAKDQLRTLENQIIYMLLY